MHDAGPVRDAERDQQPPPHPRRVARVDARRERGTDLGEADSRKPSRVAPDQVDVSVRRTPETGRRQIPRSPRRRHAAVAASQVAARPGLDELSPVEPGTGRHVALSRAAVRVRCVAPAVPRWPIVRAVRASTGGRLVSGPPSVDAGRLAEQSASRFGESIASRHGVARSSDRRPPGRAAAAPGAAGARRRRRYSRARGPPRAPPVSVVSPVLSTNPGTDSTLRWKLPACSRSPQTVS